MPTLSVPWLPLLLLGTSALSYEILLIRLFSVLHWHHFAYMAIGLALLGHGVSGTFLAFTQKPLLKRFPQVFILNILLFAISTPLCYFIAQSIPFNTQEIIWGSEHWWRLLLIEFLLMLPFFFAANVIGLTICYFKTQISFVYAAELIGSGLGAFGVIGLLYLLPLKDVLLVISVIALLAAVMVQVIWKKRFYLATTAITTLIILILTGLTSNYWPTIKVSDYKGLNKVLQLPDTAIIHETSSPIGLINTVSSPTVPLRFASGVSLNYQGDIPEQLGLFIDGESWGGIIRYDGKPESVRFLEHTTDAVGFVIAEKHPKILIMGLGDGTGVLQSMLYSPSEIDIVEPNQQLVELFTKDINNDVGWHYLSSFSHVYHADLRGWFGRNEKKYDLITLHATEGANANLLALRTQYTLTLEAFKNYWSALSSNGILSITVWQDLPPRAALRVINTIVSMLGEEGINHADKHIAVIRSWQTVTILLRKSAFDQTHIKKIKTFNQHNNFDPVYYSGISPTEANQHNQLQKPYYYAMIQSILQNQDQREAFLKQYPFNLSITTDNAPYFYHFFKTKSIVDLTSLWRAGGEAMIPQGYLVLWFTLSQTLLLSLVLIALPLHWLKRRSETEHFQKRQGGSFFVTIGLAFLMVEWVMVEQFILFLSHPAITGASVIGAFLIFSGLGSFYSQHLIDFRKGNIWLVGCSIFILCIVYHFLLPELFVTFATRSLPFKIMISFFTLAPLAFLMGMPFPLGLSKLARNRGEIYLPWAWGVNGCASVVSVSLATIIALNYGFSVTLLLAATLYLLAALLSRSFTEY